MNWQTTHSLDEYESATADFVAADPVRNILLVNIPARLRRQGMAAYGDAAPRFGWTSAADGRVLGVFVHTPPYPVLLSDLPPAAVPGFVDLVEASDGMTKVNGPLAATDAVSAELTARTGLPATVEQHARLFLLGDLVPPDPAPTGALRFATTSDRDLLIRWFELFSQAVRSPGPANVETVVDDAITRGALFLWDVANEPTAMAAWSGRPDGTVAISQVFTPAEHRRHGYAAAATAAVSRWAREAGAAHVVLFADVLNATATAVYERIGFEPVADRQILALGRH